MFIGLLLDLIRIVAWLLKVAVIASVVLSYFMSPWHPVRRFLDRIIEPMLRPIRRILPRAGMLDFSPIVLIILIQIIEFLLVSLIIRAA